MQKWLANIFHSNNKSRSQRSPQKKSQRKPTKNNPIQLEMIGLFLIAASGILLVSALIPSVDGWLPRFIIGALNMLLGLGTIPFLVLFAFMGIYLIWKRDNLHLWKFVSIASAVFTIFLTAAHLLTPVRQEFLSANLLRGGGIVGAAFSWILRRSLGQWGAIIVLIFATIITILQTFQISLVDVIQKAKSTKPRKKKRHKSTFIGDSKSHENVSVPKRGKTPDKSRPNPSIMPYFEQMAAVLEPPIIAQAAQKNTDATCQILDETFAAFQVNARTINARRGPVVTRYEVRPAAGVRVGAIMKLDNDLARALSAKSIRIEAPVPGDNVVGIEVPNTKSHIVRLRNVIDLPEFQATPSTLTFALGEDVIGRPQWADLTKMPHMLVAGATNSGKSACLNAIITSLLMRNTPDDVQFSLIDPKRVELSLYRGIPHLCHEIATTPDEAVQALHAATQEMERRYELFEKSGVRNITSYNKKARENGTRLHYIVIVIDELADLMMTAAAEFEALICRIAQLARATGIHLIVATQRPSVDVITGTIKANIPVRIAFSVASQVDSRTILGRAGAERLIGAGDMLFDANNGENPIRIQGAFLSEDEVNRVVNTAKKYFYGKNHAGF